MISWIIWVVIGLWIYQIGRPQERIRGLRVLVVMLWPVIVVSWILGFIWGFVRYFLK